MLKKCAAIAESTGVPCSFQAQPNSLYCGMHKAYKPAAGALAVSDANITAAMASAGIEQAPVAASAEQNTGRMMEYIEDTPATDGKPKKRPDVMIHVDLDKLTERGLAQSHAELCIDHCKPVMIWGPPGVGKTSWLRNYANKRGWRFEHIDVSRMTMASEVTGLPVPIETAAGTQVVQAPKDFLRRLADDRAKEDAGEEVQPTLLFFDEFSATVPEVQNAITQVLYDRRAGDTRLPSTTRVVVAGNRASQSIHAESGLSEHMSNRLRHINYSSLSTDEWAEGELSGWDSGQFPSERKAWWISVVKSFGDTHNIDGPGGADFWNFGSQAYEKAVEKASELGGAGFFTPRSYSEVCDMLASFDEDCASGRYKGDPSPMWKQEMMASLGDDCGQALYAHAKIMSQNLPDLQDWLKDPENNVQLLNHKDTNHINEDATLAMINQVEHACKKAIHNIRRSGKELSEQDADNLVSGLLCFKQLNALASKTNSGLIGSVVKGKIMEIVSPGGTNAWKELMAIRTHKWQNKTQGEHYGEKVQKVFTDPLFVEANKAYLRMMKD